MTIFDVGEYEGRPYIVMEYFPGGSLADRLAAEGAQPLGRTLEWLRETAAALDAAHAHGIVHRDVKPANLLLDDEGGVHVADFGVASAAHLGAMTETGTVVGTAGYLSPEQARGERATAASDRYALAVVAFELLTGTRPFARDSATAEALAHVSAPIPPASQLRPDLPREVDAALARGLAKAPGDRYSAAADLVDALRAALDDAAGPTRIQPAPAPVRVAPRRLDSCRCWLSSSSGPASSRRRSSRAATTRPRRRRRHRRRSGRRSCRRSRRRRRPPSRRPRNPRPLNPRPLNPRPRRRRLRERVRAERRGLRADAGGRLRVRAATPRAGRAALVGLGRARRSLRELQPRLHPALARLVRRRARPPAALRGGSGQARRDQTTPAPGGEELRRGTTRTSSRADPRTASRSTPGSRPRT